MLQGNGGSPLKKLRWGVGQSILGKLGMSPLRMSFCLEQKTQKRGSLQVSKESWEGIWWAKEHWDGQAKLDGPYFRQSQYRPSLTPVQTRS